MQPSAADTRAKHTIRHERPNCVIPGWGAAWTHLERVNDDVQRNTLSHLVRTAGLQGAPAMGHLAALLRYYAGTRKEVPAAPKGLHGDALALVERRAVEALRPYVDKATFPDMRRLP